MDVEIGKWYKNPKGPIYKINFATQHPIDGRFYIEMEIVYGIYDYSKRGSSTRYEMVECFYSFFMEMEGRTEQQLLNTAYINCTLLSDLKNTSDLYLDNYYDKITEENKKKYETDRAILSNRFNFKRSTKEHKASNPMTLRGKLINLDDSIELEINSPY